MRQVSSLIDKNDSYATDVIDAGIQKIRDESGCECLPIVAEERLLGSVFTWHGNARREIGLGIAAAGAVFSRLLPWVFSPASFPQPLKLMFYCVLVRTVLVYCLCVRLLTKNDSMRLELFQNRVLRKIMKAPAYTSHESNESLRRRAKVHTIESYLRLLRPQWFRRMIAHPHHSTAVRALLWGKLPWEDHTSPTPRQRLLQDDMNALFTANNFLILPPADAQQRLIHKLTKPQMEKVLSFRSSHDPSASPHEGNLTMTHECSECRKQFPSFRNCVVHTCGGLTDSLTPGVRKS